MPIYTYKCKKCGKITDEFFHSSSDSKSKMKCKCGGTKEKGYYGTSVVRMAIQTGFMSHGVLLKKDKEMKNNVRSKYFGDTTDDKTFVE